MKDYIYTVWNKPWDNGEYFFNRVCITLSTEMSKLLGNSVTIYTDTDGKSLLEKYVDKDVKIDCMLDNFKETNKNKWAMPKMFVLNNIEKPVCHIDYDVFLFKAQKDLDADITVQNLETIKHYASIYKMVFDDLAKDLKEEDMSEELSYMFKNKIYGGYNCGYIDVKNVDLCKYWTKKSLETFNLMKTFNAAFNCILPEQTLLYTLSLIDKIKVDTLYTVEDVLKLMDDNLIVTDNAYKNGYCHLMSTKYEMSHNRRYINIYTLNKLLNCLEKKFNNSFKKIYDNSCYSVKTYLKYYEKYYC